MGLLVNITVEDEKLLPIYAHFGDGGADLRCKEDIEIRPGEVVMVGTGVCMAIPYGYAGFLLSRSGHGKVRVSLANSVGLIDHQYTNEIKVLLTNDGLDEYKFNKYDRIAQICILPVMACDFVVKDKLQQVERAGFGSSGNA
jgi:dUTP pyrophosphatase